MEFIPESKKRKIWEITHKNYSSRTEITKNLIEIVGEPQDWENIARSCLITEAVYRERWISGGTNISELFRIEEEVEAIFNEEVKYYESSLCCKLKKDFFIYLATRKKGEVEAVIVSRHIQITSTKFFLIVLMGDKICNDCQSLKKIIENFIQKREKKLVYDGGNEEGCW